MKGMNWIKPACLLRSYLFEVIYLLDILSLASFKLIYVPEKGRILSHVYSYKY